MILLAVGSAMTSLVIDGLAALADGTFGDLPVLDKDLPPGMSQITRTFVVGREIIPISKGVVGNFGKPGSSSEFSDLVGGEALVVDFEPQGVIVSTTSSYLLAAISPDGQFTFRGIRGSRLELACKWARSDLVLTGMERRAGPSYAEACKTVRRDALNNFNFVRRVPKGDDLKLQDWAGEECGTMGRVTAGVTAEDGHSAQRFGRSRREA